LSYLFDEMKQKMILMIGAAGSGKSTWAEVYAKKNSIPIVSTDRIRGEIGKDESDQSVSAAAFDIARLRVKNIIQSGQSVIVDATNMYKKARRGFLDIVALNPNVEKVAIVFELSKNELLNRNTQRHLKGGRNVPEHVIDSMLSKYQRPDRTEFDSISFI
jgi:predicted kinase